MSGEHDQDNVPSVVLSPRELMMDSFVLLWRSPGYFELMIYCYRTRVLLLDLSHHRCENAIGRSQWLEVEGLLSDDWLDLRSSMCLCVCVCEVILLTSEH